jgi:HEAT repeat protein
MQSLIDKVLAKDHDAITEAKKASPSDITKLAGLAKNSDPAVRRLVLLCLDEVGGPIAEDAFIAALGDEDLGVLSAAMIALHSHPATQLQSCGPF